MLFIKEKASKVNESELVGSFNHIEAKSGSNNFGNLIILLHSQNKAGNQVRILILFSEVEAGDLFTVTGKQVAIDKGGSVPATGITQELPGENFTKVIR